jgi:hypothetical protein
MSQRQRALDILKKYQDALADRLAELVIEQEEHLLDDATGLDLGFTNDLFDVAEKLRAVSVTLSVMPPEQKPAESFQDSKSVVVITSTSPITMRHFLGLVKDNDLHSATQALSCILGIPFERASDCTLFFTTMFDHYTHDTLTKLEELMSELNRSMTRSLDLMKYLFNLTPDESLQAVLSLKATTK